MSRDEQLFPGHVRRTTDTSDTVVTVDTVAPSAQREPSATGARRGRPDMLVALVVVVSVAAVVGFGALVRGDGPSGTSADAPAAADAAGGAAPGDVTAPDPGPGPDAAPGPAPEPDPVAPPAPATLRIATLGVAAPVVSVGLDGTEMEIPDDVREIGWYDPDDLGVRPGTPGTAVFASHVDSRSQGQGVLFELFRMRAGDLVELDLEDGTAQTWRVTEVAQIPKDAMPMLEIFTWAGPPRVAIITCGGEFDRSSRSYRDNIVVYAVPLDAPSA